MNRIPRSRLNKKCLNLYKENYLTLLKDTKVIEQMKRKSRFLDKKTRPHKDINRSDVNSRISHNSSKK